MGKDKLKLKEIMVQYGKTSLNQVLECGYNIRPDEWKYDEHEQLVSCGLYKKNLYIGEILFFNISRPHTLIELKHQPIGLMLMEKQEPQKGTFLEFLEFTGASGKKDVRFLCGGYIIFLILLLLSKNDIPDSLFYSGFALPIGFIGISFLFWQIKKIFTFFYRKLSLEYFTLFSIVILLIWNLVLSYSLWEIRKTTLNDLQFIPLIAAMGMNVFICYQIIRCWLFQKDNFMKSGQISVYLVPHLFLYLILGGVIWIEYVGWYKFSLQTFTDIFISFMVLQLFLYGLVSLSVWIRICSANLLK